MKNLLPILIVACIGVIFWSAWHGCNKPKKIAPSEDTELRKRVMEAEGQAEQLTIELAYLNEHKDTVIQRYYSSRDIVRNTHTTDTIYRDVCLAALNDCDSALQAAESIVSTQDSIITVKDNIIGLKTAQIGNCNRDKSELELQNGLLAKKVKRQAVGIKVLGGVAAIFGLITILK